MMDRVDFASWASTFATSGLALVAVAFVSLSVVERLAPRRATRLPRRRRHLSNALVFVFGTAASRMAGWLLVAPVLAWNASGGLGAREGASRLLARSGLGDDAARALVVVSAIVALDLSLYAWHRLNHISPFLWRFHRVHHADPEMDVTTALRFHAGELALSVAFRAPVLALLGTPLWELAAFDTAVTVFALFHHANIGLGRGADRVLSRAVVTPGVHEIHHARAVSLRDSNFGVFTTAWDRLFGTWVPPREPPLEELGVEDGALKG